MILPGDWENVLKEETSKLYFADLQSFVNEAYLTGTCYPPKQFIFEAFRLCPFAMVRVVILGQDPYHGAGQAHGLAFSVNDGMPFPPSLRNIFKEVAADTNVEIPFSGNLSRWAEQGALLLNTTLTVQHGKAGSHLNYGWEVFTDAVIRLISEQKEHVVFMLWGNHARAKAKIIDPQKHLILESCHPSPLSANRQNWFGNQHFSKANSFLQRHGQPSILW